MMCFFEILELFFSIEAENFPLIIFISNQLLPYYRKSLNFFFFSLLIFRRFSEGTTVITREQEFNEIIFISEGEIELSFELEEHRFSRFFKKGFYFGDYNILSQKPSEFNYTFKKDSKCFCFPKTKFIKILGEYPPLKDSLLENSFQNYKDLNMALVY